LYRVSILLHRKIVIHSLHGSKMLGYIHLNIKLVPNRNILIPNRNDLVPNRNKLVPKRNKLVPYRNDLVPNRNKLITNGMTWYLIEINWYQIENDSILWVFISPCLNFCLLTRLSKAELAITYSKEIITYKREITYNI
jgi:hypothetical protein